MIKDRLEELKSKLAPRSEEDSCRVQIYTDSPRLEDFFTELQEVYDILTSLFIDIEELKKDHSIILTSPYDNKETEAKVDELMQDFKVRSKKVKTKLKEIEQEKKKLEKEESTNSAVYRIYQMQHMAILYWFTQAMVTYNKVQTDFRDACKSRIKHHLKITGRLTTDDEVEEMLESGNAEVFSQGIVITQNARQTLADIEARHEDITKLEKSIRELHEMFVDLALLVENQGELINNIARNVSTTVDYTVKGKEDIVKARTLQSKYLKNRCILIVIVLVILLILGLIIYFSL